MCGDFPRPMWGVEGSCCGTDAGQSGVCMCGDFDRRLSDRKSEQILKIAK